MRKDLQVTESEILARLTKIERQVRIWRTLTLLSVICCAAAAAPRLDASSQWLKVFRVDANAIVAQEFDLVNPSGRVIGRLAPDPKDANSPNLVLKYPNDKAGILLGVDNTNGPSIGIFDSKGETRAMMYEHENGPALTLFDENNRIRIEVDALNPGPQISIYDKNRKRTVVAFSD
jgi:hypothetical protein